MEPIQQSPKKLYRLKVTPHTDFTHQGDHQNFPVSEMPVSLIEQKLRENPKLCAVYSSKFKKIYFKWKAKCWNPIYYHHCTLYELIDDSPWLFKDGKTAV